MFNLFESTWNFCHNARTLSLSLFSTLPVISLIYWRLYCWSQSFSPSKFCHYLGDFSDYRKAHLMSWVHGPSSLTLRSYSPLTGPSRCNGWCKAHSSADVNSCSTSFSGLHYSLAFLLHCILRIHAFSTSLQLVLLVALHWSSDL